jgi:RNA polymerase-interacting CarD/CdnL/TRCF family regulator
MGSFRNPIKVLMPVAQAEAAGLRRPITRSEAEGVLQVFQLPATPLAPHSREELDEVAARLNSHDLRMVAATIRDLVAAGVKGWPSQPDGALTNHRRSEHAMLTQALERLIEELAYVQRALRKTIEEHIRKCLGRTRRRRAPAGHPTLKVRWGPAPCSTVKDGRMHSLGKIKGAVIQDLDAVGRRITVSVPPGQRGPLDSLTFRVDDGALVANKHHQLMKVEEFQIGSRVSVVYAQQPDGTLLAKSVILERGVSVTADRAMTR